MVVRSHGHVGDWMMGHMLGPALPDHRPSSKGIGHGTMEQGKPTSNMTTG